MCIVDESIEQINYTTDPIDAPADLLAAALFYARLGWAVVPLHTPTAGVCSCPRGVSCQSPGKHPRTANGLKNASTDIAAIRQWWTRWPSANIGIATGAASGLLVIDIDGDCELPAAMRDLPRTITATTARGRHLYFRMPSGARIGNKTRISGLPIDLRVSGGYVVAPPSIHVSGAGYTWETDPDTCPPADPPAALVAWLTGGKKATNGTTPAWKATASNGATKRQSAYVKAAIDAEVGRLAEAIKGERNDLLNTAAFKLYQLVAGGDLDEARLLDAIGDAISANGLADSPSEVRATIASARAAGMANPRTVPDERHAAPLIATAAANAGANAAADPVISPAPGAELLTDLGNGRRFANDHGSIVRYCHPWQKWLIWDGTRWKADDAGRAMALAKSSVTRLYDWAIRTIEAMKADGSADAKAVIAEVKAILAFAIKSQHIQRIKATIDLARSECGIPILPDSLDRDPWALNCMNGTLDLRTGELRPHEQRDNITKLAPVVFDPAATCPNWERFLLQVFDHSDSIIGYMQRLAGYWLTGQTTEHALPVLFGHGANGKSTFIGAIFALMGSDYSGKASRDLLTAVKGDRHPTALAWLHGKRFAACIETSEGARLDEALIKELTGGDEITARRMREDYWGFTPTHKIALVTNHKPQVRGTDHAIWRRLRLIPFEVCFAEVDQDKNLPEKLRGELPGILKWALAGCLDWQRHGLADPPEVTAATAEYRSEQDRLAEFLADRCQLNREFRAKATDLYAAYREWCEARGETYLTATGFGMAMGERGINRDAGRRWYVGLAIRGDEE